MENNMDDMFDGGGYSINYEELLKQNTIMSITKLLAFNMMTNSYVVVGDYIRNLSNADLNSLMALMDEIEKEEPDYEDLILIAEMLATGEGCPPSDSVEDFKFRMEQLVMFLTIESLSRKGLVKVHHNNMSFHEDCMDKIIVEKLDD